MKLIKPLFFVSVLVLSITSCKKQLDTNGPYICAPDDYVLTADQILITGLDAGGKVDLANGGVNIQVDLGIKIKWDLIISNGSTQKSFSGWSDKVNLDWFGQMDALPFFNTDQCTIELTVSCKEPIKKALEISSDPSFKNLPTTYGFLFRDWDKNGVKPVAGTNYITDDGWSGGAGLPLTFSFDYYDVDSSPAGGRYAQFEANFPKKEWYFGGHSVDVARLDTFVTHDNADSLYFNVFVRGFGVDNSNMECGFIDNAGNKYFYTTPITWNGWKLISVKMSEFTISAAGPDKPVGSPLTNLSEIKAAVLQLGAAPEQTTTAKSAYDFMIITVGEPFVKQ